MGLNTKISLVIPGVNAWASEKSICPLHAARWRALTLARLQTPRRKSGLRVLDRNDSHRFWFRAAVLNGQRLNLHQGNERSSCGAM